MTAILPTNLGQAFGEIDKWLNESTEEVEAVVVGLTKYAFDYLLMVSPQYSGDFVANWNLSNGGPDTSFQPYLQDPKKRLAPHLMGDLAPINEAVRRNHGRLDGAKLGDSLWISNTAYHTEFYAFKIENNKIQFRPGNMGEPVMRTLRHIKEKFGRIGKAQAQVLIARSKQ